MEEGWEGEGYKWRESIAYQYTNTGHFDDDG